MKFSLNWELDALSCGITGFLLLLPTKWLHGHVFTVFIAEAGGLFHLLYSVYVYPQSISRCYQPEPGLCQH